MDAYWKQFSTEELLSWQGVETMNDGAEKDENYIYYFDNPQEEIEEIDEPISLESLGMSWRDFF